MHSEPPLDNHDPQCRLQMATSPCWWPIVTGGSRNPPSAKSLPRRQFNQRLRQENRTEDNGDGSQVEGGCEHWHSTCAHHFARAIYLLHLLPPFFVHMWWQRTRSLAGLAWDVSAASGKRTVVLCVNKTLFSIVQSCVSVWVQEAEEVNLKTGSATLMGNIYNQTSTKTCNRSSTSQWTNVGCPYFAPRTVLEHEN